jgi:hypothetical protein
VAQMQSLVDDEPERRPFALLLVARLAERRSVEVCPVAFRSHYEAEAIDVSVSPRPSNEAAAKRRSWVERLLAPAPKLQLVVARIGSVTPLCVRERVDRIADRTGGQASEKRK